MEVEILSSSNARSLAKLQLSETSTIKDVKKSLVKFQPYLHPNRQSVRLEQRGKTLKDSDSMKSLGLKNGSKLYVKDLGPQIGWTTVFLCEYAGPLFVYLIFYWRPSLIYGNNESCAPVVRVAAMFWSIHYIKRLYETVFIHRFSHSTMPMTNLFKNCFYYWGFAAFVSYHVNHPLYTAPCAYQSVIAGFFFILCELGNLSIHLLLRDLRPPGTKVRRIPYPNSNPLTILFNYVSCPNYFYEFGSWVSFTIMTSALPAGLFALAGMYQMSVWALGKHRNYKTEFPDYPKNRKAIIPYIL